MVTSRLGGDIFLVAKWVTKGGTSAQGDGQLHRGRDGGTGSTNTSYNPPGANPDRDSPASPHAAGINRHHGLPGLATESVAELWHVLHDAVRSELPRRVRVGLHLQPELFGAGAATPTLSVTQKELLDRRVAVLLSCQVDVLSLCIGEEGNVGQTQAAIVGRVLAQGQLAVDLHVVDGDKVTVFL